MSCPGVTSFLYEFPMVSVHSARAKKNFSEILFTTDPVLLQKILEHGLSLARAVLSCMCFLHTTCCQIPVCWERPVCLYSSGCVLSSWSISSCNCCVLWCCRLLGHRCVASCCCCILCRNRMSNDRFEQRDDSITCVCALLFMLRLRLRCGGVVIGQIDCDDCHDASCDEC